MSYNLLAQRKLDDMEASLEKTPDAVERIYNWYLFIKDFSQDTQTSFNKHYEEFVRTCEVYVMTPDPGVRAELKKQISSIVLELQHFNEIIAKAAHIQRKLETDLIS